MSLAWSRTLKREGHAKQKNKGRKEDGRKKDGLYFYFFFLVGSCSSCSLLSKIENLFIYYLYVSGESCEKQRYRRDGKRARDFFFFWLVACPWIAVWLLPHHHPQHFFRALLYYVYLYRLCPDVCVSLTIISTFFFFSFGSISRRYFRV